MRTGIEILCVSLDGLKKRFNWRVLQWSVEAAVFLLYATSNYSVQFQLLMARTSATSNAVGYISCIYFNKSPPDNLSSTFLCH